MRNNRRPQRRQEQLLVEALAAGRSVVIDNTNPDRGGRASLIAVARRYRATIVGHYFPTEAKDALRRNRARTGRERVPDVAIFTTRKRLDVPTYDEGFDQLIIVTVEEASASFALTRLARS